MAPKLTENEIDDLIYFARVGEQGDLDEFLSSLAEREKVSKAEILAVAKDEGKSTCLHMAAGNGILDIIKSLLEHFNTRPKEEKHAFLDAQNEFGNTGMHWAALGGHLDVVKLLMENGASPAIANDQNFIPLDSAGLNEKTEVVDYFLSLTQEIESGNQNGLSSAAEDVQLDGEEAEGALAEEGEGRGDT